MILFLFLVPIPLAPEEYPNNLAIGKARAALERNVAHSSCAKGIPLAPEDLQINLASGKARAALERNVAHSSCAKGICATCCGHL